jgi:hypothetical protein
MLTLVEQCDSVLPPPLASSDDTKFREPHFHHKQPNASQSKQLQAHILYLKYPIFSDLNCSNQMLHVFPQSTMTCADIPGLPSNLEKTPLDLQITRKVQ